ncbi:RHS repeat-associated core domain-containing protein [Pseudomonas sp. Teo4]|uniref:RHS repeat-associated core domain-containing protein n=1 Tax=Pseudomonas sp. Teo4 TaxID=3064528 RepID=UPI002ABC22E3|nr:RHS repeat-associated core domain-containing protein [Pseudomonas sp. Teo4]MDZ3993103.1 hypothetical protein [Pseudomonas sp. Teo4]
MPNKPTFWFYNKHLLTTQVKDAVAVSVMRHESLPLAQISNREPAALFACDPQCSTLSSSTLSILTHFRYGPFGYSPADTSETCLLQFNGERLEHLLGCYLLGNGHRAFNPKMMRFHSPDHLSPFAAGGLNSYMYCHGDPINLRDPSGKSIFHVLFKPLTPLVKITIGGLTIALTKQKSDFLLEVKLTTQHALTRGPIQPHDFPVERKFLMQYSNKSSRPFDKAVNGVNFNLATHGDASLTMEQATYYIKATHSGSLNTASHWGSTKGWGKGYIETGQPQAAVGAGFNFIATVVSGPLDHAAYKTGKYLSTQEFNMPAEVRDKLREFTSPAK